VQVERSGVLGFFSAVPPRVKWLIFAGLFNNLAIGYLVVYLTAFFPEAGVSPGVVGLLLGLEGAMLFLSIPLGIRSDRKGRKSILLIGASIVPVPMIIMALTFNVALLIVAALLFGICESAFLSTWNAMMADQTDTSNRDATFSLSFIVSTGGFAFGVLLPLFLPWVESLTGLSSLVVHRELLVLVGLLSVLTPLMVYRIFKNYEENINSRSLIRGPNFRLLLKFSGINGMIGLGAGFIIPLIPTWLFLKFQLSDEVSGPVLAVSGLTIALAAIGSPRISKRLGLLPAILATQGVSTVFMLSLAFVPMAALAISLYIIRAALMNMAVPLVDSYLMGIMSQEERGLASAINTVIWRLPNSISTAVGGFILAAGVFDLPFYLAAGLYALAIGLFYGQFRNIHASS
jgi:MFS family permease